MNNSTRRSSDYDEGDNKPRRKRQPPPPKSSSALPWIISGVIGGGALLICVPAGIVSLFFFTRLDPAKPKGGDPFPDQQAINLQDPQQKNKPMDVIAKPGTRFQVDAKNLEVREFVFAAEAPGVGYLFWDRQGKVTKYFDYWDWKEAKRLARLELTDDGVRMNLSPQGTRLLMQHFSQPTELSLWALPDGKALVSNWNPYADRSKKKFEPRVPEVAYVEFLDEDHLLTFAQTGQFELWDLNKKQTLYSVPPLGTHFVGFSLTGGERTPQQVVLSQDRKVLAVDNRDGFSFFDPRAGKPMGKTAPLAPQTMGNVWSVSFNRSGTLLASRHNLSSQGAPTQEFFTVWEVPTGGKKWQFPIDKSLKLTGPITWVGSSHVILWDGNVFQGSVLNLTDGRYHRLIDKASIGTKFTHVSPDGRLWCLGNDDLLAPLQIVAVDFPEHDLIQRPAGQDSPNQAPKWFFGSNGIARDRPGN